MAVRNANLCFAEEHVCICLGAVEIKRVILWSSVF